MPFAALVSAVIVALAKMAAASFLLHDPWRHEGLVIVDGALSGTLAGALVWIVLGLVRGRRRRLIEYIRRVADLNHHIRNALQILVYQASLTKTDPEQLEQVESAVRRVDAALHEIFPIIGDRKLDAERRPHDLIH